jgi:hypothetical protein
VTSLHPADSGALADWQLFTARLLRADPDAAVRLSVGGDVLVLTTAPLYPAGLGDTMPLVLAMRMLRLSDSGLDGLDRVVPARALGDRFARAETTGDARLPLPPTEVPVAWTARTPPRTGWTNVGEVPAANLVEVARAGIAEVAQGSPSGSGGHAVSRLRRLVWSREVELEPGAPAAAMGPERLPSVPAGMAYAGEVLGFLPHGPVLEDSGVTVFRVSGWLRLTTRGGHLLTPLRSL